VKVQELINRLADFRGDAIVTFWFHDEEKNQEGNVVVTSVFRDRNGNIGINWQEDAVASPVEVFTINND